MKRICFLLLAVLWLCSCEGEPTVSETVSEVPSAVSEETLLACEHVFGDEPVEIVGNLYVFECVHCGERKVVPQGTLIGGEE